MAQPDRAALPPPSTTARAVAPEQTASFQAECARSVLASFVDAFNRADRARLATFFSASEGDRPFQWFVTPETPPYGPDLLQLGDSLAAWHAAGERWRLVSVQSGDGPSWHGGVDFAVRIERSWSDRSVMNDGKGALDCAACKIFVFGLGAGGALK